jgi:hypothetical protein
MAPSARRIVNPAPGHADGDVMTMDSSGSYGEFFGAPPPASPGAPRWVPNTPAATGGAVARTASDDTGVPEPVAVSVTLLGIAAVAGLWFGLMVLTVSSEVGSIGFIGTGGLMGKGLFYLANGAVDIGLVVALRAGSVAARWIATLICGGWACYWVYETSRAGNMFGEVTASVASLAGIGFMTTLGLLLGAVASAVAAGLLWLPSAGRHFDR